MASNVVDNVFLSKRTLRNKAVSMSRFLCFVVVLCMLFFSSTANTVSASALFENYNSKGTVFEGQCPPCNCVPAKTEQIWSWLVYFATTLEVLVRGFSLGFGARMLKYIFFPEESEKLEGTTDNLFEQFKRRAIVSMISGLSVAAFIHGSSLFIPTQLRDNWFDYVDQ